MLTLFAMFIACMYFWFNLVAMVFHESVSIADVTKDHALQPTEEYSFSA